MSAGSSETVGVDGTGDEWSCGTERTEADLEAKLGEYEGAPAVAMQSCVAALTDSDLEAKLGGDDEAATGAGPPPCRDLLRQAPSASRNRPGRLTAELLAWRGAKLEPGTATTKDDKISDAWSCAAELTEANLEAELRERDGTGEPDADEEFLRSLGMILWPSGEPLLLPPSRTTQAATGTQPPPYRNLFWRQFVASQGQPRSLTAELLARHGADFERGALPTGTEPPPMTAGEWLGRFKAVARSVPVKCMAASLFGRELGSDIAGFIGLGAFDTSSELHDSTVDAHDLPNGEHVIGQQCVPVLVSMGTGRTGFAITDEISIATPGRSSSRSFRADSTANSEALSGLM